VLLLSPERLSLAYSVRVADNHLVTVPPLKPESGFLSLLCGTTVGDNRTDVFYLSY
jgi:hypothetical protein